MRPGTGGRRKRKRRQGTGRAGQGRQAERYARGGYGGKLSRCKVNARLPKLISGDDNAEITPARMCETQPVTRNALLPNSR